jgi:hypothetical protein
MSLQLSGDGVVTGLDSLASSDLGAQLGSKLPIAGGKILQIVRATDSTLRTTTSTSFVDVTGLSVTITPQKSDSAILINALFHSESYTTALNDAYGRFQITDASNNAISGAEDNFVGIVGATRSGTLSVLDAVSMIAWATPATTSAVTYKLRFRTVASVETALQNTRTRAQIFAIEVSA